MNSFSQICQIAHGLDRFDVGQQINIHRIQIESRSR